MPGSDTVLAVDRTYSDPERHRRRKARVRRVRARKGLSGPPVEAEGSVGMHGGPGCVAQEVSAFARLSV